MAAPLNLLAYLLAGLTGCVATQPVAPVASAPADKVRVTFVDLDAFEIGRAHV